MKRVTRDLVIDSRDRDAARYPHPNAYVVQLPDTLFDVTSVRLLTAEIPASFYVFTAARGTTSLTLTINGTPQTVTIPDGNYGFATMADTLTTLLAAWQITVSIDATTTLKTTLASAVATDTLRIESTPRDLASFLGFGAGVTESTGILTSPRVACMNPETYVVLDIRDVGRLDECGQRGAFAKIPLLGESFEYTFFDKAIACNVQNPPIPQLAKLHITFRFHDGTLLDFNGIEHTMTLQVECSTARPRTEF